MTFRCAVSRSCKIDAKIGRTWGRRERRKKKALDRESLREEIGTCLGLIESRESSGGEGIKKTYSGRKEKKHQKKKVLSHANSNAIHCDPLILGE